MAERSSSRGWPWKKKIAEKLASAALEFKHSNDQLAELKEQAAHGKNPLQQAEAKIKILTEQLTSKDEMIIQHAKVAEEAVSGWEKAESEATTLRQQLEAEIQKRQANEDRVTHLDGALKECMRQLRHVREQQEQKIHEMIVKKAREWEVLREQMESKMAKIESELLGAEAEKLAMNKSLQERAKTIKDAKEGRTRAEEEINLLQVKLQMSEKEQAKWKYEVHVLSKELEIRNEELEYNKKTLDAVNKQHLEDVKKIARLENECQRLRLLVRKKLPGPAAVAQMRLEVEALGIVPSVPSERRGRSSPSPRRSPNSNAYRAAAPPMMRLDADTDQLFALADENRALREALMKTNNELQSAKQIAASTASKLSSMEEQLENASTVSSFRGGMGRPKTTVIDGLHGPTIIASSHEPSVASISEDGNPDPDENNGTDLWASALMSELAHFGKKEKGSAASDALIDADFMDDFAEMEKLAALPTEAINGSGIDSVLKIQNNSETTKSEPGMSDDMQRKLARAEDELSASRLQKIAAKSALLSTEKQLLSVIQTGDTRTLNETLDEVRAALNDLRGEIASGTPTDRSSHDTESAEVRDIRMWSPSGLSSCQSEESAKQDIPMATINVNATAQELTKAMQKVVCLIEALPQVDCDVQNTSSNGTQDGDNNLLGHSNVLKKWKSSEFSSCVQSLVTLCNGILQGKIEIMDFLAEMASALDWLINFIFSSPNKLLEANTMQRQLADWDSRESDDVKVNGMYAVPDGTNTKVKFHGLLEQLNSLTSQKEESDRKVKMLSEELETLKLQLNSSTKAAADLQSNLTSTLESRGSLLADMESLVASKKRLESQLLDAKEELKKLEEKALSLEVQLEDETQCRKDIETMYQNLLDRRSPRERRQASKTEEGLISSSHQTVGNDSTIKTNKDQVDIAAAAEKLAECQQTILALGKQLKDLGISDQAGNRSPPRTPEASCMRSTSTPRSGTVSDMQPSVSGNGNTNINIGSPSLQAKQRGRHAAALSPSPSSSSSTYNADEHTTLTYDNEHRKLTGGGTAMYSHSNNVDNSDDADDEEEDAAMSRTVGASSSMVLATAPAKSPARFLSLKSKTSSKMTDSSSQSEKHSMGFSRFFRKTARS